MSFFHFGTSIQATFREHNRPTCLENQIDDVVIFVRSFQSDKMTTKVSTEGFGISSGLAGF